MLDVARGSAGMRAAGRSLAMPRAAGKVSDVAADDGSWIGIPPPSNRQEHTAVYDPVRNRMLVFGGFDSGGVLRDDVWALSLVGDPVWSPLTPVGIRPASREFHTAIYDPVRDRMLVFGGYDADFTYLNDVWALSLAGSPYWTQLAPEGVAPSGRWGHTAIYDPVRDRMLVFGGGSPGIGYLNDVWALSLAGTPTWSALAPTGGPPLGRVDHTAIYDPVRDRMVVFGGSFLNDVWALSLAGSPAWSQLAPSGTPPSGRENHTAIYDPVRDRMLMFAGGDIDGVYLDDLWALSLAGSPAWTQLAPTGGPPAARLKHTAIYDPANDRMVVFGGVGAPENDLRALSLPGTPAWAALVPGGGAPVGREEHTAIYDPLRDRMLVFGGSDGSTHRNDVWALSLAGNPTWGELFPTGTPPSKRWWHSAIYDPVRDRMLVFGGGDVTGFRQDVWALSLDRGTPAWSALAPAGTPPSGRYGHTAIYDPVRDRMLVFGGSPDGTGYLNDVWALSLAGTPTWSALAPTGGPPLGRVDHTAIYDPVRDRMVVFGGSFLNDVWALSLAGSPAWSQLAPSGTPPSGRENHTAIYDPVRDRMLMFGGFEGYPYHNDVWALSLAGSPAWSELAPSGSPPSERWSHTAFYDPVRDRMVTFGGLSSAGFNNDVWALAWQTAVSVPGDRDGLPSRFALAAPRPNPSRGPVTLDFTVPRAAHVSLVVFDAAGRMIRKLADGQLPPGRHSTSWDGRDRNARAVRPGVYLVRLVAPGAQLVRKAVVAE